MANAAAVVAACQAAGVSELLFVRHANSAPLASTTPQRKDQPHHWKRDDQMRVLTDKGREQCEKAAPWFGAMPVRCILSSPARRASETAAGMAYQSGPTLGLRMVEGVHPAGMSETCEHLFESMGYGPLRKFYTVEGGEAAFVDYADRVCAEIAAQSSVLSEGGTGTCVAIFGHAVFLNAIALEVCRAAGCSAETNDLLLDLDLGETEGIHVYLASAGAACKRTARPLGGAAVVSNCLAAGVTQLLLVRHANAAPLASDAPERAGQPHHWKQADQMRVLTPKGVEQCAKASAWFATLPVRCIVSSPARRASETAMNMAAQVESEGHAAATLGLTMVEGIHPAGMSEYCEMLFETMGYGPLRNFYGAEGGEASFRDFADRVCVEIAQKSQAFSDGSGTCVAFFGHAVFLNAIALELCLASECSMETVGQLLDLDLGETHGILIDLAAQGSVTIMTAA